MHQLESFVSPSVPGVSNPRPTVEGKFLYCGNRKLWIRGVTYGTFRPNASGSQYPNPEIVEQDFARMAANGINTVRTYTVPDRWFLDAAQKYNLYVMVGLPWEQHIAFLDERKRKRTIEERIRDGVKACAGHSAVLCYTIGNEIPAPIVRWHGRQAIEEYLERLYWAAKSEDPDSLFTYVNYPTTEYLQLPFVDLVCFNVFLESEQRLSAYLARLQNIAGDKPLLLTEMGLDSNSNGHQRQAETLDWQVRTAFSSGCAGVFVFAWTDEWYRGGFEVSNWDFGLTDRERNPKPALVSVRNAFAQVPFSNGHRWPRISVIICSYNGSRTIRECCDAVQKLEYPNFEVVVIDDGSTDATATIAREYGFRVISTENRGLSSARNLGMQEATGEIVAYIDDDAFPDPHWLFYLAESFLKTTFAGIGGPNVAPRGDGWVADCIANAPGGPIHVLLTDQEAEHIPGCNMAFRKDALLSIGGFDTQFRVAGDDVDICWRLQQKGEKLGFSPSAMVWHHRRKSIRSYWRQQRGYGKAEALLEAKWPKKYNGTGHLTWAGNVYGKGLLEVLGPPGRIYHGIWGMAPFQLLYRYAPGVLQSLPLIPEWYLILIVLTIISTLGIFWQPLLVALPLLLLIAGTPFLQALKSASRASFTTKVRSRSGRIKLVVVTALLHILQPLARLIGRFEHGLTPWRGQRAKGFVIPIPAKFIIWSETWVDPQQWLHSIEASLRKDRSFVKRGGDYDRWDLCVAGGMFGTARVLMAIEEHAQGKQLLRFRIWPNFALKSFLLTSLFLILSITAMLYHANWIVPLVLAIIAAVLLLWMFFECGDAMAKVKLALKQLGGEER